MENVTTPRWAKIGYVVLGVVFVAALGVASTRLTLFWDDYEFVRAQLEDPWGNLLMGTNGHAGSLTWIVLRLETYLFGLWYPGYVMANGALAVASTVLFLMALRPRMGNRWWLAPIAAIVYLTSLGLVGQTYIFICLEWFLCFAFAGGAALAVSRRKHWGVWTALLVAAWLSMSGIFPIAATMVAVVYALTHWSDAAEDAKTRRRVFVIVAVLVVLGVAGAISGSIQTNLFTTDYYRAMADATGSVPIPKDWLNVFTTVSYLSAGWTAAPLLVVALTSTTFILTLTIFFAAHAVLFYLALVALLAVLLVLLLRLARRRSWPTAIGIVLPFAMILPAIEWALLLSAAREGAPFPVRYQMVWLLPMVLMYAMVLAMPTKTQAFRVLQVVAIALLSGSALVGIVRLPATLQTAADGDKPRWEKSMAQREQMVLCANPSGPKPVPVDDISPALSAEVFCTVVNYLRENSLTGRVLGFDG